MKKPCPGRIHLQRHCCRRGNSPCSYLSERCIFLCLRKVTKRIPLPCFEKAVGERFGVSIEGLYALPAGKKNLWAGESEQKPQTLRGKDGRPTRRPTAPAASGALSA